jgi:serine O-acetyltransferase
MNHDGNGATAPPEAASLWRRIREDVQTIFERDPAARSVAEVVLAYPGFHAVVFHRLAHWLWTRRLEVVARVVSHVSRFLTGIEIHPGAKLGRRFFIDHGMGIVIGETAELGDDVMMLQGATLGGTSTHRGEKRHPTIEDWVVIGTGATVLGPVTIGRHSRIGAGSVVVTSVPEHSTVVGIPGKVVRTEGKHAPTGRPIIELDHADLPDPIARALGTILEHVERLEQRVADLSAESQASEARRRELEDIETVRKVLGS